MTSSTKNCKNPNSMKISSTLSTDPWAWTSSKTTTNSTRIIKPSSTLTNGTECTISSNPKSTRESATSPESPRNQSSAWPISTFPPTRRSNDSLIASSAKRFTVDKPSSHSLRDSSIIKNNLIRSIISGKQKRTMISLKMIGISSRKMI